MAWRGSEWHWLWALPEKAMGSDWACGVAPTLCQRPGALERTLLPPIDAPACRVSAALARLSLAQVLGEASGVRVSGDVSRVGVGSEAGLGRHLNGVFFLHWLAGQRFQRMF